MAMVTQELSRLNGGEVIYYLQYEETSKQVGMFGCQNHSNHDARGSLIRPSGLIDAQADFPPQEIATWVIVRAGMAMVEAPDEPGYFESPYQFNGDG